MTSAQKRGVARYKLKSLLMKRGGKKCYRCGYNKCRASLTFHHVVPSLKLHTISNLISGLSRRKAIQEAAKCILLCHNCHVEYHQGVYELYPYEICWKG